MPAHSQHSLDDSDVDFEIGRADASAAAAGQGLVRPRPGGWRHPGRRTGWSAEGGCSYRFGKSTGRLVRLAVVCLLCPAVLLGWPLYMRYSVLRDLALPLAPSDVRVLDLHVSTTWCQAQEVRANGSFNAWVLGRRPQRGGRRHVSMVRDIRLGDDTKEYWGFYLLEGSVVTVSPCCRWPGVSLVVIRGYDHLLQCAYIGDDSSEEEEEVRRVALRKQLEESRRLRPPPALLGPPPALSPSPNETDAVPSSRSSPRPKQRSNLPQRMHVVKEEAVELHEKTRPPPRLFNRLDWGGEADAEASPEAGVGGGAGGSAEVARGLLEQLRRLGATGERALDRLRKARLRRDLMPGDLGDLADLADQDAGEAENTGAEVEAPAPHTPASAPALDRMGDVRGWVNETTSLDESHSELWSSFSSSEEALLACAGLVLNLPLTPHRQCQRRWPTAELGQAAAANVITYRVPTDGHYFFVLGSENEVQTNFVRVRFDLDKVVYDIDSPLAECKDQGSCSLPLRFLSDDTLVMEVPVPVEADQDHPRDHPHPHQDHVDHVLAVSTCRPRTAMYVACVLALPAIILACAF